MVLLSQAQLVSGSKHPYLYEVDSNKEYIPHSWLSGIRQYLRHINATIEVHHAWIPKRQRENDVILMDTFKTTKPGTATLDHLNQIRLYLGVTMLADIRDDNGKVILRGALNGTTRFRPTTPWSNQEESLKFNQRTWQRYL
eukprot:3993197-Ditylum_brightwellii.AAC.1